MTRPKRFWFLCRDSALAGRWRREQLRREIDATDRQVDRLVYDLYQLTDDEVAVVEAALA